MNDPVAGVPSAVAPKRELAKYLLDGAGASFDARAAVNENRTLLPYLQDVRAKLERQLIPLATTEPKMDGKDCDELRKYLRIIGAACRPDFTSDQANVWIGAVIAKCTDLPGVSLCRAAAAALHQHYEFLTQAEGRIRQLAQEDKDRTWRAMARANAMQEELNRARDTTRQITDRVREPMATEEVHEWQRKGSLGTAIVNMGLAGGWILSSQLLPPDELPPPEGE